MTDVSIPKLGVTMEEAMLQQWLVSDGSQVTTGDALYILEADKTEVEIESPASGTIAFVGTEGETYDVGTVIARIG